MSISSSEDSTSYLIKAHLFVKKANEAEQLGLFDDAIEYNFQASNYYTLAIKQTNHEQTIEALKVLSHNHYKKSLELQQQLQQQQDDDHMITDNKYNTSNNININNNNNNMYFMQENFVNNNNNINNNNNNNTSNINTNMYINQNNRFSEQDLNKQLESTVDLYLSSNNKVTQSPNFDEYNNNINNNNNIVNLQYGLSPPSSFWMGIEKLLEILPKPIFGNRKTNNNNMSGGNGISSLTESFFIVNNQKQPEPNQPELNQQLPQLNDINSINNIRKSNSIDDDTINTIIEENNTLKKENDFLKERILQFRNEIEKKTSKFREQSMSRSTIINPTSQSTFTPSSTFVYNNNNNTNINNNNSNNNNEILLLQEVQRLKSMLEEKDQIIVTQNQRWNKLVDGAKKKREMGNTSISTSSIISNLTPILIVSPSTSPSTTTSINIVHQHQKVPNPF